MGMNIYEYVEACVQLKPELPHPHFMNVDRGT